LACIYGKTIHYMMVHAGLSVRPSRAPNAFNTFKAWFANEYHNHVVNDTNATKCMSCFALLEHLCLPFLQ
jgi:hypothetical protein